MGLVITKIKEHLQIKERILKDTPQSKFDNITSFNASYDY
tara:strand:+ start:37 stop:156 length:120 start_codon:yes stop_codon:yes gene_type:complete